MGVKQIVEKSPAIFSLNSRGPLGLRLVDIPDNEELMRRDLNY